MTGRARIAEALDESRARTLSLLAPLDERDETAQFSPLMSPLVWDLAHIAHYEELWLLRALGAAEATDPRFDDVYDAFRHPRRDRPSLDLLGPADARAFAADVRKRVLDVLATTDLSADDPLLRNGFVYGMVVQHEHQHDETMLAALQLRDAPYPRLDGVAPPGDPDVEGEVVLPGEAFTMGTSDNVWAYDNERPAHIVEVAPFHIDAAPVTNRAYLGFVRDRGYRDDTAWSEAGRAWRDEAGLEHPEFWRREPDDTWVRRRFGHWEPICLDEPVQHVCWYEAEAFARWRGARLPTEAEWEYAAAGADPDHAHLAGGRWAPDPVGSHPTGASEWGCHQMLGDVWEWTATEFHGYPGFVAFPYREYSEVFFGAEYKMLRGGSWATHPLAMRTTFRNWDYPIRRQIFAGFRCARDG